MPELPEVETIRLGLEKYLAGKGVTQVQINLPKVFKEGDPQELVGAKLQKVRRFGKVLVFDFSNGLSLAVHIKLTGQFIYVGPDRPKNIPISIKHVGNLPSKFTHVVFHFGAQDKLFYNDIRQFGWMRILPTDQVEKFKFIEELGPEPFGELTLEKFVIAISGKTTKIKPLLLDQTKLGGVGNIYANDALFLAGIDPRRPAKTLTYEEQEKLYEAIHEVLRRGLKYGGASELNYVNALGAPGEYQNHFLVYGRQNQECVNGCEGRVEKISLGGRGTYFCPNCQS